MLTNESTSGSFPPTFDVVNVVFVPEELSKDKHINKALEHFKDEARELLFRADNVMFAHDYQRQYNTGFFGLTDTNMSDWMFNLSDLLLKLEDYISNHRVMNILYQLKVEVRFEGKRLKYQLVMQREFVSPTEHTFPIETRKHLIDTFLIDNPDA